MDAKQSREEQSALGWWKERSNQHSVGGKEDPAAQSARGACVCSRSSTLPVHGACSRGKGGESARGAINRNRPSVRSVRKFLQSVHARTAFLEAVPWCRWEVHAAQNTPPQIRQWCRRRMSVNPSSHRGHSSTLSFFIHSRSSRPSSRWCVDHISSLAAAPERG